MTTHLDRETALHMAASFSSGVTDGDVLKGMARIAEQLVKSRADVNAQDSAGR